MTRRQLVFEAGAVGFAASAGLAGAAELTARGVVDRIRKNVGVPWREQTVDTFKAGDPDTPVKGIATSFGGTLDVLQRAAKAGRNFIVVHEPTFYNHQDETKDLQGEVYEAKQEVLRKNGLVVWRFHDHWHARRPDGVTAGLTAALGWDKYRSPESGRLFVLPAVSLSDLAKDLRGRLKIRTLRVVGNPDMKATRIALSPGFNNLQGLMRTLERPDVDVLVIGESREWEGIEYARDAVTAGKKKGLIVLGHVPSEESGMEECARWLKTFVSEVPIEFMPSGEPFWTPAA